MGSGIKRWSNKLRMLPDMPSARLINYLRTAYWRVKRTLWYSFYYGFAQHLPASYRFKPFGKLGKWCRALACKRIFRFCGQEVNIEKGANFYTGWEVEIGDFSSLGINCVVPFNLKIGRDVMMGPDVIIIGENHRFDNQSIPMRLQGYTQYSPVQIQDDVWIGARSIILPGLTIGKGAIIGAGAVVTKNVPPYAICAGNPARVLRIRSSE
jgi:maltose O-acetyltransferase